MSNLPINSCSLPDPPPTYERDFLVEEWLANSDAHEQAHNVQRFARYAPELGWPSILAVLELPDAESCLAALAYPLGMLISRYGTSFIDRIELEAGLNPAFRACLAEVRPDPTFPFPQDLWPRLSTAAGTSIGPMARHMAGLYAEMPNLADAATWDPNPMAPEDLPTLGPKELAAQAQAWLRYQQTFWAWQELNRIYQDEGLDAVWPVVLAIIEKANDGALGSVGAGILEDMLRRDGAAAIDRVEAEAARDPRFRFALSHVWRGKMPANLWDRVVAARGEEPQRG